MAVFCLKNFHSRFLLFINALPLKEQTDCANGEKTRSTPSHPQALVQEDGNVALGVLPKDRPTSQFVISFKSSFWLKDYLVNSDYPTRNIQTLSKCAFG